MFYAIIFFGFNTDFWTKIQLWKCAKINKYIPENSVKNNSFFLPIILTKSAKYGIILYIFVNAILERGKLVAIEEIKKPSEAKPWLKFYSEASLKDEMPRCTAYQYVKNVNENLP